MDSLFGDVWLPTLLFSNPQGGLLNKNAYFSTIMVEQAMLIQCYAYKNQ